MSHIKAPFNFVPFDSKKVFYPDWADQISQDIPFEDGLSGTIDLVIEAHSPIFVRNGNLEGKDIPTDQKDISFSNLNGRYFIPGTSIKGMLRSVLEILSFSKLSFFNDDRYAVRDLSPGGAFYKDKMKGMHCGWLQKKKEDNGQIYYELFDCGEPDRISFQNIDNIFGINMNVFFQENGGYKKNDDYHKSAKFKYDKFSIVSCQEYCFKQDEESKEWLILEKEEKGTKKGIIVFTGQPGLRIPPPKGSKKGKGKGKEFIFWKGENKTPFLIKEDDNAIKSFKFAYFAHDKVRQSIDWVYWSEKLENNEQIPVFFQLNDQGNSIAHLGLSYLYKLPYDNRIGDYLKNQINECKDLAECIFGNIENSKKQGLSLKGRVHFGHAFGIKSTISQLSNRIVSAVLSSPKASYYPIYIHQSKPGKHLTFMDKNARLSGRKRYPVHTIFEHGLNTPDNQQENVAVKFHPLNLGAKFQCKVVYHNLKKAELGALLSAVTFHNTEGCFHSIGMGKPLGYGKVSLEIIDMEKSEQLDSMASFEKLMNDAAKMKWVDSEELKELIAMASIQSNDEELRYMKLGRGPGQNEFTKAKNDKLHLKRYSELNANIKKIVSLAAYENVNQSSSTTCIEKQLNDMIALTNSYLSNIYEENKKNYILTKEKEAKDMAYRAKLEEIVKAEAEAEAKRLAIEKELKENAKPKSLPESHPEVKKVLGPLRTYLGKEKITVSNSDEILNLLIESYKLVSKPREKHGWEKELPKFLEKYLDDGVSIEEWTREIINR